jgi:hypothetical protein
MRVKHLVELASEPRIGWREIISSIINLAWTTVELNPGLSRKRPTLYSTEGENCEVARYMPFEYTYFPIAFAAILLVKTFCFVKYSRHGSTALVIWDDANLNTDPGDEKFLCPVPASVPVKTDKLSLNFLTISHLKLPGTLTKAVVCVGLLLLVHNVFILLPVSGHDAN